MHYGRIDLPSTPFRLHYNDENPIEVDPNDDNLDHIMKSSTHIYYEFSTADSTIRHSNMYCNVLQCNVQYSLKLCNTEKITILK